MYARQVFEEIKAGTRFHPDYLNILIGPRAWDEKESLDAYRPNSAYVMLPVGANPDDYKWDVVGHFDMAYITAEEIGAETLKIAAHCLVFGCRVVMAGTNDFDECGYRASRHTYWPQRAGQ